MKQQTQDPGTVIKSLREMSGLTLKQVAVGADTSISYLSKVENGVYVPTQTYVARVVAFVSSQMLAEAA